MADLRGAVDLTAAQLATAASTRNAILADGRIVGLLLAGDDVLTVRDYADSIALHVETAMTIDGSASLAIVFQDDTWGSTIGFEAGIPLALGGTLELSFAAGVDWLPLVGTRYQLFDWTDVTPTVTFAEIDTNGLPWNVLPLYATGEVILTDGRGDFNGDDLVNDADIDLLMASLASPGLPDLAFDLDGNGEVDLDDLDILVHDLVFTTRGLGTEYGDFNLDGLINTTDLALLATNFAADATWAQGNANGHLDQTIDTTDLAIMAADFGFIATDAIPEPASMSLLALGAVAFLHRKRRSL